MSHQNIDIFLDPVDVSAFSEEGFSNGQIGKSIQVYEDNFPEIQNAELVIVGCGEQRGNNSSLQMDHSGADAVRSCFYNLTNWHSDLSIADVGNIRFGASLNDTYAAFRSVVQELINANKTVLIIGGSHDLTSAQYQSYAVDKKNIEVTVVDAKVDMNIAAPGKSDQFLLEMLTTEPNYITHYNHIGFQSYFVDPHLLETMDKLRFDCFRLGHVKENIEEMEPVIRNSQLFSFDINSIANSYAPANLLSVNGFTGEEACSLLRYAGLSPHINTVGIYGYEVSKDQHHLTAMQIGQMIWYFLDGRSRSKRESDFGDKEAFNEFHTAFAEVETTFLQSKKTGRWWMQLPDKKFIACSYKDYMLASSNEVPERWLRAQERN